MSDKQLRQSTAVTVVIGPAVSYTSGTTPLESVVLSGVSVGALKSNSATSISLGGRNFAHSTEGHYLLGLLTTDVDTTGILRVILSGASNSSNSFLNIWEDFDVVSQQYFDFVHGDGQLYSNLLSDQSAVSIGAIASGVTITKLANTIISDSGVTVISNSDKTGYSLLSDQSSVSIGNIVSGVTIIKLANTLVSDSGVTVGWLANSPVSDSGVTTSIGNVTVSAINSGVTLATGVTTTWLAGSRVSDSGVTTVGTAGVVTVGAINSGVTLTTGVTVIKMANTKVSDSGVTVISNSDKTGYSLLSDQSSVSIGAVANGVTIGLIASGVTVPDKYGYSLLSNQSAVTIGNVISGVSIARMFGGVTLPNRTGFSLLSNQSAVTIGNVLSGVTVKTIISSVTLTTGVTVIKMANTKVSDSGVTVISNSDKYGYNLLSDQSAVSIGAIASGVTITKLANTIISDSGVTVISNSDKTGYSLLSDQSSVSIGNIVSGITVSTIISSATLQSSVTVGVLANTKVSDSGVTVISNSDKTGYLISGTSTTLDSLNDIAASDIWSDSEKQQIRAALGITGTSLATTGNGYLDFIYDVSSGRWKINIVDNTITFYKSDNTTSIATFALLDSSGGATVQDVFERTRSS